jgi:FkbM family methyltransferase
MGNNGYWRFLTACGSAFRRVGLSSVTPKVTTLLMPLMPRTFEHRGSKLRANTYGELQYLRQVEEFGRDDFLDDVFERLLRPGMTVVDGGAQLGLTTLLAARAVGARGCVVSFEPNPRVLDSLRNNIEVNGFSDRVTVFPLGLSDRDVTLEFCVQGQAGEGSHVIPVDPASKAHRESGSETIRVVSLDQTMPPEFAPDLVKLDVEGNEAAALRGMEAAIRRSRPHLLLEVNPSALRTMGSSPAELASFLRTHRYSVFLVDELSRALRAVDLSAIEMQGALKDYVDVVAIREEDAASLIATVS